MLSFGAVLPTPVDGLSVDLSTLAAIVVSLGVLAHRKSPLRKAFAWLWRRNVAAPVGSWLRDMVRAAVRADIDGLDQKIDDLSARNDAQHDENARAIAGLRVDLNAHMAEASASREVLQTVVAAVDQHVEALRTDLANPGRPGSTKEQEQ